MDKEHKEQAL